MRNFVPEANNTSLSSSATALCKEWVDHSEAGGTFEEYLIGIDAGQMPEVRAEHNARAAMKVEELMRRAGRLN